MNSPQIAPVATATSAQVDALLNDFIGCTPGVAEAVVVSTDGFLLATSSDGRDDIEQFAAIISGLNSLTKGAAELYAYGNVRQVVVEMETGNLFVMAVDHLSTVGVLAHGDTDVGTVGYEMALLIDRVETALTPELVDELKNSIAPQTPGLGW